MIPSILISLTFMVPVMFEMEASFWRAVNDGVMGGVSSGSMDQDGEQLVFSGELSLENNGGFSSVRRSVEQDLSGASKVRMEVRGDGREYQFRIRQSSRFDGVAWRAMFAAKESWQTIEIDLAEFIPVFRGRTVAQAGPVVPSEIRQVGFLLADKKAGAFKLEIRHISFIGPDETTTPK